VYVCLFIFCGAIPTKNMDNYYMHKITGVYILENTPPGGGISRCNLGNKKKKRQREKGGKGRKGKEKGKRGNKMRKGGSKRVK
jgi:hypothetical protein